MCGDNGKRGRRCGEALSSTTWDTEIDYVRIVVIWTVISGGSSMRSGLRLVVLFLASCGKLRPSKRRHDSGILMAPETKCPFAGRECEGPWLFLGPWPNTQTRTGLMITMGILSRRGRLWFLNCTAALGKNEGIAPQKPLCTALVSALSPLCTRRRAHSFQVGVGRDDGDPVLLRRLKRATFLLCPRFPHLTYTNL